MKPGICKQALHADWRRHIRHNVGDLKVNIPAFCYRESIGKPNFGCELIARFLLDSLFCLIYLTGTLIDPAYVAMNSFQID